MSHTSADHQLLPPDVGRMTIVMRPTSGGSNWWSAEVCDMKGNRLFNRAGYQIYKARWYVENPFGYPEVHTL